MYVTTAGDFFGNAATPLTVGDQVICNTAAAEGASVEGDFVIVQSDTDLATATTVGLASFPTSGGLTVNASGAVALDTQSGVSWNLWSSNKIITNNSRRKRNNNRYCRRKYSYPIYSSNRLLYGS